MSLESVEHDTHTLCSEVDASGSENSTLSSLIKKKKKAKNYIVSSLAVCSPIFLLLWRHKKGLCQVTTAVKKHGAYTMELFFVRKKRCSAKAISTRCGRTEENAAKCPESFLLADNNRRDGARLITGKKDPTLRLEYLPAAAPAWNRLIRWG